MPGTGYRPASEPSVRELLALTTARVCATSHRRRGTHRSVQPTTDLTPIRPRSSTHVHRAAHHCPTPHGRRTRNVRPRRGPGGSLAPARTAPAGAAPYAGVFVAPFLFVAAVTVLLYAGSFQAEKIVYAHELTVPVGDHELPISQHVAAARKAHPEAPSLPCGRHRSLMRPHAFCCPG